MHTFISDTKRDKEAFRLKDHAQTDLRLEGIKVEVISVNPVTKEFVITGSYADYLLAKKFGEKKEWTFQLQKH